MFKNNKKYEDMELDDLEAINEEISTILHQRNEKILEAIRNYNIDTLEEALVNNKHRRLPENAWQELSFSEMTEEDIDFFLYMRKLPQYESKDNRIYRRYGLMTFTEEAVHNGLYNEKLFDFFIDHPEFSKNLKDAIEHWGLSDDIPKTIINKMFDLDILNREDDFLDDIVNSEYDNYIEYLLESNIFQLKSYHYEKIYSSKWNHNNTHILDIVKEQYPKYNEIPLFTLIQTLDENQMFDQEDKVRGYTSFCSLDKDKVSSILEIHPFTKDDFKFILAILSVDYDSDYEIENDKFINVMEIVSNKYPKYVVELKDLVQSSKLKPIFNTYLNYASLHADLEVKGETPKKLKM